MSLTVPLDDDFVRTLAHEHEGRDLSRWALETLVLEAYREKAVSAGYASDTLGLGYFEFLDIAHERDVRVEVTEAEIDEDFETVKRLAGRSPRS